MTLEEAIKHCEEVAKDKELSYKFCFHAGKSCDGQQPDREDLVNCKNNGCLKCAAEHRQLAEWLKELREVYAMLEGCADTDELFVGYIRKKMRGRCMTNQEAIKILKNTAFLAYQPEPIEVIEEAVNKAISALQAQEIRDLLPVSPLLDKKKKKRKREKISALEPQELSKNSAELEKKNGDLQPTCNQLATDTISRQAAIDELKRISFSHWFECGEYLSEDIREIEIINSKKALEVIETLPSAQPEPLSDAYTKAVWTWLLDYQIKVAKLKGRYTPYEVLSWVANDWRKEHERSD